METLRWTSLNGLNYCPWSGYAALQRYVHTPTHKLLVIIICGSSTSEWLSGRGGVLIASKAVVAVIARDQFGQEILFVHINRAKTLQPRYHIKVGYNKQWTKRRQ